jgi:hypothetical protein
MNTGAIGSFNLLSIWDIDNILRQFAQAAMLTLYTCRFSDESEGQLKMNTKEEIINRRLLNLAISFPEECMIMFL